MDGVLDRARRAGVTRIVVPAYDRASWEAVAGLARRDGVRAAYGLHPWAAAEDLEPDRLVDALRNGDAVAVGELGLDFAIDAFDRERQLRVLRPQLETAAALDLPVLLHCRSAFEELLALLREFAPGLRGVVHAFSRGPDLARRFLDLGFHLGFGGAITRPNAVRARRSAVAAPWDRIVLETDAPSIGLDGIEAAHVEPRHVLDVARSLAELRGEPLETVARRTTENARALFRIP